MILVRNLNDSGPGSLRTAVADATSGDTIDFASHLAGRTITLQSEIDITKNINIRGPVARPVILSGGGETRVIEMGGASVSLANLVISNGAATAGGGILESSGSLNLKNVQFKGNFAYGSTTQIARGGAIEELSGDLDIERGAFTGNRVVGNPDSPDGYPQLGIVVPLDLSNDYLSASIPTYTGGEADGGAIASIGGTVIVGHSSFAANQALGSSVQSLLVAGDSYGGAVYVDNASLTSLNNVFRKNQAVGGDYDNPAANNSISGGSASGGAIAADASFLTLQNNTVSANIARGGIAQNPPRASGAESGSLVFATSGSGVGGGIALLSNSTLTLVGGSIGENQASGGTGDFGSAFGGGLDAADSSDATIVKATFTRNVARSGNSPVPLTSSSYAYAGSGSGGAVDFDAAGTLTLINATLDDNHAIGGNAQSPGSAVGGGVSVGLANSVAIDKSTFKGNVAQTGRGFVALPFSVDPYSLMYSQASGGALYDDSPGGLSLDDSRIVANRAVGFDNGIATGGGLMLLGTPSNLFGDTLQSNRALGGSIVTTTTAGQASGGAIAVVGQPLAATNCKFTDNRAKTTTVNETYAQTGSNDASLGGAIYSDGGDLQIINGVFTNNRAVGGTVTGGSAGGNAEGGAIDNVSNGSLELSGSLVRANQAMATSDGSGLGGGLYLDPLSTNTLSQDNVVKNKASTEGDNIYGTAQ